MITLQDLTAIIPIIISAIALYIAWRKAPHEEMSIDAGTMEAFERAATSASERASRLEARIGRLEQTIKELQDENAKLREITANQERRIEDLERENGDLREWAENLHSQVVNLGGTPVEMRRKRSRQ